ncbi:MAG TPA: SRPBCC family protein [Nocardioidaceae bacterium]|nr:SRPBCC family protein [Nocardioidaceae bacterium]
MTTGTKHETEIGADPTVPTITILREFDAPPDRVHRAWTDPELVARWMGPRSISMRIDAWDCRTGGSWRYAGLRDGEEIAGFYGSFHEVRPDRIVQTFTFDGEPDGVALETVWFEALGDGRTRVRTQSLCDTFEARDAILSSGMDVGVREGYEKLDELLAEQR